MKLRPPGVEFGSELTGYQTEFCDVCIVGSGPGGAVAADALTRAGRDVLVIEEGALPPPGGTMPPEQAVTHYYRDLGLFTTAYPTQIPVPTGQAFGGTTVINSGTCFPTPGYVMDGWRDALGVDVDRDTWRAAEAGIWDALHIEPCSSELMCASSRLFAEGLHALGREDGKPLERCAKDCQGGGLCCFVCPHEAKQAMHLTYLQRALGQGLRAIVETRAVGLVVRGREVKAVTCTTRAGGRLTVHAKQFILAMGALGTPEFLLRNGLHRRYRTVGRNLTIHPAAKVFAQMPEPVHSWQGVPQAYGYNPPEMPDVHFEGVFIPPFIGALNVPYLGEDLCRWMSVYDRLVGFGFFVADSNRGRLFRVPGVGPVVWYGLGPKDLDGFHFAISLIAEAYFAVGAERVLLPLLRPDNVFESHAELVRGFRREGLKGSELYSMGFHPLGTCRFAGDSKRGVVDAHGRLHHHDNLRILDGSAIPGPLHVNPQVTIMAFAQLAADRMLAE